MTIKIKNDYTKRTTCQPYTSISLLFLQAKSVTIKETGEVLEVPPLAKLVYTYMRNNYCVAIDNGNKYFESWSSIALNLGLNVEYFKHRKGQKPNLVKEFLVKVGLVEEGDNYKRCCFKEVLDITAVLGRIQFNNNKAKTFKEISDKSYQEYKEQLEDQDCSPHEPKVNNFMVTKKWRNTFEDDPVLLKEFNRWMYRNDKDNIEIKDHDVREWRLSQQNPEPSTKEILKSKLNPNVCDDYGADKGLGWFCNHLLNNSPSKVEVIDYLSIINKRGWWDEFSPTQEQAETLLDKINEKYKPLEDFNPFPDDEFDSLPF